MPIAAQIVDGSRRVVSKVLDGYRYVSCSCCGSTPLDCCMYPASGLDVRFTIDDLPDSISSSEGVVYKNDPPIDTGNGLLYYGIQGDGYGIYGGGWAYYFDTEPTSGTDCLIQGPENFPKDTFLDEYTIETYETFVLYRTGLCTWEGTDSNGCTALLTYNGLPATPPLPSDYNKWVLSWSAGYDAGFEGCGGGNAVGGAKDNYQNSPVGTYTDIFASVSATISVPI